MKSRGLLYLSRFSLLAIWLVGLIFVGFLLLLLPTLFIKPDVEAARHLGTTSARRYSALDPYPFGHNLIDSLIYKKDGGGSSCSLLIAYTYKIRKTGTPFSREEFNKFRRWAIKNDLFMPPGTPNYTPGKIVDFDKLNQRLPEFFGGNTPAVTYSLLPKTPQWAEQVANALDMGNSVIAITGASTPDHVVTLLEAKKDGSGVVSGFLVSDPNSYEFWTATPLWSVEKLYKELPLIGLDNRSLAIGISTSSVYSSRSD